MYSFRWGVKAAIAAFIISLLLGIASGVGPFPLLLRAIVFAGIFFGLGYALRYVIDGYFPDLLSTGEETDESEQVDFEDEAPQTVITVDTMGEYALPELYKTPGDPKELGNIEDLISGNFGRRMEGVDRKKEEEYNVTGGGQSIAPVMESPDFADLSVFNKSPPAAAAGPADTVFTPSFGDDTGLGGLPDLDAMATAFSSGGEPRPEAPPAPVREEPVNEAEPFSFGDDDVFGGADLGADTAADEFVPQKTEEMEQVKTRSTGNKPQPLQGDFKPEAIAQGIRTVLSKDQ
jgi:hypothetical protein